LTFPLGAVRLLPDLSTIRRSHFAERQPELDMKLVTDDYLKVGSKLSHDVKDELKIRRTAACWPHSGTE
jgi:hypothetical protein